MPQIMRSLIALLNIAYDPTNYPAFFFSKAIPEIIPYIHVSNFNLASTAKFILSCLHLHLDCDQLLSLRLNKIEAEYCVDTFKGAISSPDFTADGFAAHELLQILRNLTHPCVFFESNPSATVGKLKTEKEDEKTKMSYFDCKMCEAAEELMGNCSDFIHFGLVPVLESSLKHEMFRTLACRLLWNLLYQDSVKENISTNYPGIVKLLVAMQDSSLPEDQLLSHCCLWRLGKIDEKGT